ncbi:hypothetical protein H2200_011237 [Cladophialophora chaetospira]|uniref:Uncharacterized protein n=1 Tax=Cladophialophora chaetospira TaxID=386627 RepID=A0AA39CDL1_9EURO|nr:hypothetical protein H2200_011237 [Cladophialophora chaetospira]
MRGLWTHASRPRLRCSHHYSAGDSFTSTLVRKTTTRPPRRRPSFTEHIFTVLLTPVLAAALFVDTSWKSKQRRDWDERLAAVNDEIEQLRERERQFRSSVQLRKIHHGLSQQRRSYASAALASVEVEDDKTLGEIEMPIWEDEASQINDGSVADKSELREAVSAKEFSPEQMSNFRRYHRLNAITLALRMLLHLRVGPNPFYSLTREGEPVDIAALATLEILDEANLPTDTDRLVQMLALTRKQMRSLRNQQDLIDAAPQIQAESHRGALHQTIQQLTAEFDSGSVALPGLISGYGKAILQSKEAPCTSVYITLIRSLSKIGSYSLAYHAAAALKNSTLPISDAALFYMLLQIGRACDSRSFNNLLHFIANKDNPMNLNDTWEKTRVHSLDLPIPSTLNPRLLMALVYVSLRCEQPERAEAWLSLLREKDYGGLWKDDLFRSFLAYHSQHGNWQEGKKWLQRCVEHASSIANHSIDRLARVIYRMLDLCVRCRKLGEYTAIINAAVDSGIGPPLVDKTGNDRRNFHPRTRSILLEWEALPLPDNADAFASEEKARSFQYACKSLIKELSQKPQTAEIEQENHNKVARTAATASATDRRYATRGQGRSAPAPSHVLERVTEEFNKLQSKVTEQEAFISEMKARFDLSLQRQKSYEEEAAARTQKWTESAKRLGEEVQETLQRFQKLKVGSSEQEAAILELKIRTALSASRREEEAERERRRLDATAQMAKELEELKERFEKLQRLNEMHQAEKIRQGTMTLEPAVERVASTQLQQSAGTRNMQQVKDNIHHQWRAYYKLEKEVKKASDLQHSQSRKGVAPSVTELESLLNRRKEMAAIKNVIQKLTRERKRLSKTSTSEVISSSSKTSPPQQPQTVQDSSSIRNLEKSFDSSANKNVAHAEGVNPSSHASTPSLSQTLARHFRRESDSEDGEFVLDTVETLTRDNVTQPWKEATLLSAR